MTSRPASLRLEPLSHPALGEIRIDDCLFAVGRTEPPFADQSGEDVSRLSRRHARIFQQDGHFWLADLESRNGTSCNGTRIARKPVALSDADEISFAGIRYRACISDQPATAAPVEPLQLTLVPVDMPGCDPLIVSGFPFLVSKSDGAFAQHREMFRDSLAYISRRHAHFYRLNDELFIEDLNSTNGTFLNGTRLEEHARRLQTGDSLAFGNPESLFRVEIRLPASSAGDEATETGITVATEEIQAAAPQERARKTPQQAAQSADQNSEKGSGKGSEKGPDKRAEANEANSAGEAGAPVSDGAQDQNPELLSRQSAVVDSPVACSDASPRVSGSEPEPDSEQEQGTILVDKASPFLDIFYDKEAGAAESPEAQPVDEAQQHRQTGSASRAGRRVRKLKIFWSELKGALLEEPGKGRRPLLVLSALAVVTLAGAILIYQRGAPEREVRELIAQGEYAAGARLADQYLVARPGDEELLELAGRSTVLHLLPGWIEHIEARDFERAEARVAETRSLTGTQPQISALLDLVSWMTRLEAFVLGQQGDTALVVYRDEADLRALIEQWQDDVAAHRLHLSTILREVPAFKTPHAQVMSHLRLLQSYNTIYLKASDELAADIDSYLASGDLRSLRARVSSFQQKYPKVGGTGRLLADIDAYQNLLTLYERRELLELLRLWQQTRLHTPPFRQQAELRIASTLPPKDVSRGYLDSESAWRAGDADQAIALLTPLIDRDWGDFARARVDRYQRIRKEFEALAETAQQPRYQERLLRFYSLLEAGPDDFYRQTLQAEFSRARDEVSGHADADFTEAQKHWSAYRSAGGITGLLRLEESVSRAFRARAAELSKASEKLLQGSERFQLLSSQSPARWQSLKSSILTELKRQRSWLKDLDKVLPEKLVKQKLQLLPPLQAESSNAADSARGAG